MLKILHICSGNYYGGIEEVVRLISLEQNKSSIVSDVIYFQKDFIPPKKVKLPYLLKLYYIYRYISLQRIGKYKILHNHSGGLFIDVVNILIFHKSISVSHNHGCRIRNYILKNELKLKSGIKEFVAYGVYKKIPRISVSNFIHDLQNKFERTYQKMNFLLPNPIDFQSLEGLKNDNPKFVSTIGYLGRIVEYKGLKTLINFANYQKINGLNYKFLICGPGEFSNDLKSLIKQQKLEAIITFENQYVKKKDFFERIDVFISLPSFESFGLTLYEAVYCGKPIITLQKQSLDPKLSPFVWCLDNDKPEEIVKALADINEKKDKLNKYHFGMQNYLLKTYSINKYVKELEQIYKLKNNKNKK